MSLHARLAACIVFMSFGPCASAQLPPPPAFGSPPRAQAGPAAPVVSGRIQRWLINANGEAEGLLLADGTQVSFPQHLAAAMQQVLMPGDTGAQPALPRSPCAERLAPAPTAPLIHSLNTRFKENKPCHIPITKPTSGRSKAVSST